jgi:hypothetical protein
MYGTLKIWTLIEAPTHLDNEVFRTTKRNLHTAHGLTQEEAQDQTDGFKRANPWLESRAIFAY